MLADLTAEASVAGEIKILPVGAFFGVEVAVDCLLMALDRVTAGDAWLVFEADATGARRGCEIDRERDVFGITESEAESERLRGGELESFESESVRNERKPAEATCEGNAIEDETGAVDADDAEGAEDAEAMKENPVDAVAVAAAGSSPDGTTEARPVGPLATEEEALKPEREAESIMIPTRTGVLKVAGSSAPCAA